MYVINEYSLHRTLLELVTNEVEVSIVLLDGALQVRIGMDPVVNASTASLDWTHVVVILEDTAVGGSGDNWITPKTLQISMYVDGVKESTSVDTFFPTSLSSATMGNGYTGFLQDVGIFLPALTENEIDPESAVFLPQCLCYLDATNTSAAVCNSTLEDRY